MIILLISASFTGSILFTLLLRKMDRSRMTLAQIKRMGEIQGQQLDNTTREHLRTINDASLEFTTLIKQSRNLRDQLEANILDYSEKLNSLNQDRELVGAIGKELSQISTTARNVNDQAERVELGLEKLGKADDEFIRIRNGIENLTRTIDIKGAEADARIHQITEHLAEKSASMTDKIIRDVEETLLSMREDMESVIAKVEEFDENQETRENDLNVRMQNFMENLDDELREKSDVVFDKIRGAIHTLEEELQLMSARVAEGTEHSETIKNEIGNLYNVLEEKLSENKSVLTEKWAAEVANFHEEWDVIAQNLEGDWISKSSSIQQSWTDKIKLLEEKWSKEIVEVESNWKSGALDLEQKLEIETARIEEKWILETGRLEEKFGNIENKLLDRFHSLENGLTAIRTTAVESLQNEVSRIRSDLDNFNLEAISRRDEILNETRRMAEGMGDQINLFQEKYIEAENRLVKFAEQEKQAIRAKMESFEDEWDEMEERRLAAVEEKIKNMEIMIDEIRDREIEGLGKEINTFRDDFHRYVQTSHERLDQKAKELQEKLLTSAGDEELHLKKARDKIEEMSNSLDNLTLDLRQSLKQETEHSLAIIHESRKDEKEFIIETKAELKNIRTEVFEKADEAYDTIHEFEKTQAKIDQSSRNALEELDNYRDEILENLETRAMKFITVQDEKLGQLSKTIDEKISHHLTSLVDRGQFKLEELEKRTSDSIRDTAVRIENDLETARNDFKKIRDEVKSEMLKNTAIKEEIFSAISKDSMRFKKFEDRLEAIDRAQELAEKLDETVEILSDRLDMAREENSKIDQYVRNLEAVRLSRKELERELQLLDVQRSKIADTEKYISNINGKVEELHDRMDVISAGEQMADRMEERVIHLSEYKDSFEKFFIDMSEKKKYMENAIRFIEKSKQQVKDAKETAEKLLQKVERAEIRQIDMDQNLQTMESKTNLLNNMEDEIQKVEARFEQMEGLMKDMENRQKQIGTMNRRMEEIRTEGEDLKTEMESLLNEADEKMERLSAFFQTVEKMIDTKDTGVDSREDEMFDRSRKKSASGVADWKREGILSLYLNHKWEPDLIADRMKIDPAVVRAVISSHV